MRSRYRMALWVGLGLVVAGYAPGAGAVTTNVWTNAAGGRFDVSGNWDPAGPPGSADTALFNAGGLLNRTVVTFSSDPSVTNKTANFTMARYNASNRWEFVIGDDAGPAVYDAGATILGGSYLYNADFLLPTGTLRSSSVALAGYDAMIRLVVEGSDTVWLTTGAWTSDRQTLDFELRGGARLEAQGQAGTEHKITTEAIDGNRDREQVIRVTGSGTALIMTNLDTTFTLGGRSRFELSNGATGRFSKLTLNVSLPPYNVVISNATLLTKDLVIGSSGTNEIAIVDAVLQTESVTIPGYQGTPHAVVDNTDWTMNGTRFRFGGWDGPPDSFLRIQNGSRLVGTNLEFNSQYNKSLTDVLLTDPGTVLHAKSAYVSGASSGQAAAGGSLVTVSNGAVLAVDSSVTVFKNGVLRLAGGTVSNAAVFGVGGVLEGDGTILGSVETSIWPQGGLARPGGQSGIGRLCIGNLFRQSVTLYPPPGRLELEIGGLTPGTGYDQLAVTNAVTLAAGTVIVTNLAGYKPPFGVTTYDLITGSSVSTNGATVVVPPGEEGIAWSAAIADLDGGRKALRITSERSAQGTLLLVR